MKIYGNPLEIHGKPFKHHVFPMLFCLFWPRAPCHLSTLVVGVSESTLPAF